MQSIYEIPVTTASGEISTLAGYRGKVLLIVNTASRCGFTPQYAGLEALHRAYAGKGLALLGFPCNQFAGQEPGDMEEIRRFCSLTYDVTFPLFAKVDVNGNNAAPLFRFLSSAAPGILGSRAIKWNFTKFLVDRDGNVLGRYAPATRPEQLARDIEAALNQLGPG